MNKAFLYEMLRTESVSGGEIPLQKKVAAYMREQGAEVETDLAGDVISSINSASPFRVLLCGHIDEIGFRVTHITDDGYLQVGKAGGIRLALAQGKRVTVLGRKRLTGVMGLLLRNGEVRTDIELTDLYIDCGFTSRAEALELVAPGDFVTYSYAVDELENDCIAGRGLDNRLGAYTVLHALLRAREKGAKVGVFAATTTGEETTMRGAFHAAGRVRPTLAVAVDVIHTSDFSGMPPPSASAVSSWAAAPPWPRARCAARLSTGRWRRPPGGWESPCSMPSPQALWAPMRISSTRRVRACP